MTEEEIKAFIASEVEKQLTASSVEQPDYEVLETIMFEHPKEWGRRVIKRENEVLLQTTSDLGNTWQDSPIPDARLILTETRLKTQSNNPYSGLTIQNIVPKTKSISSDSEVNKEPKLEVLSAIESGRLLGKTTDEEGIETVTFLGVYSIVGLQTGQLYQDTQGYIRISQ